MVESRRRPMVEEEDIAEEVDADVVAVFTVGLIPIAILINILNGSALLSMSHFFVK